ITGNLMRLAVGITSSPLRTKPSPPSRGLTAMATLPAWASASGRRRDSSDMGVSQGGLAASAASASALPALAPKPMGLRRVLRPHLVEEALAVRGHVPGVRPEAQVHAPPVVGHGRLVQRRQQLVEVQLAGAERVVRAGAVLVQRAVRVDQVDVGDLALELLEQLLGAAGQRLLGAGLVGAYGRDHVSV